MVAVRTGNFDTLRVFMQKGPRIDPDAHLGNTALHIAVICGDPSAVAELLAAGASVTARNEDGRTPLNCACMYGDLKVVRLLVEQGGSDLSEQSTNGSHPIFLAAEKGHDDLTRYLIRKKAPVNLPDGDGITPLMVALLLNHMNCFKLLLEAGADVNKKSNDDRTPLMLAVVGDKLDIMQMLLDKGANTDAVHMVAFNNKTQKP